MNRIDLAQIRILCNVVQPKITDEIYHGETYLTALTLSAIKAEMATAE